MSRILLIYFWKPNRPDDLYKVININNNCDFVSFRRFIRDETSTELVFIEHDSAPKRVKRTYAIDDNAVHALSIGHKKIRVSPTSALLWSHETNLENATLEINDQQYPLNNFKSDKIYKAIMNSRATIHNHYNGHDNFEDQPDWANIPNQTVHPTINRSVIDFLFANMHNRSFYGRQLIHFPNARPNIELCPHCHTESNIYHALLDCPIVNQAWQHLETIWNNLSQPYDHIIDNKIYWHYKLFGLPRRSYSTWNARVLFTTLEILIGKMQETLRFQTRAQSMDNILLTTESLIGEWTQKMVNAVRLLMLA